MANVVRVIAADSGPAAISARVSTGRSRSALAISGLSGSGACGASRRNSSTVASGTRAGIGCRSTRRMARASRAVGPFGPAWTRARRGRRRAARRWWCPSRSRRSTPTGGLTPGNASCATAPPSSRTNHGSTPRRVSSATAACAAVPNTSSSQPKLSQTSWAGVKPCSSSRSTASQMATTQPLSSSVPRPQTAPSTISAPKGGCCQGASSSTGTTSRWAISTTGRSSLCPAQRNSRPWRADPGQLERGVQPGELRARARPGTRRTPRCRRWPGRGRRPSGCGPAPAAWPRRSRSASTVASDQEGEQLVATAHVGLAIERPLVVADREDRDAEPPGDLLGGQPLDEQPQHGRLPRGTVRTSPRTPAARSRRHRSEAGRRCRRRSHRGAWGGHQPAAVGDPGPGERGNGRPFARLRAPGRPGDLVNAPEHVLGHDPALPRTGQGGQPRVGVVVHPDDHAVRRPGRPRRPSASGLSTPFGGGLPTW